MASSTWWSATTPAGRARPACRTRSRPRSTGRRTPRPPGSSACFPSVYRNLGNGKFVEISAKTGLNLIDRQTGYPRAHPLAVAAVDANGDGRLDLLFTYQSGGTSCSSTRATARSASGYPAGRAARGRLGRARRGGRAFVFAPGPGWGPPRHPAGRRPRDVRRPDEDDSACRLPKRLGVALLDYDLDGRIDIVSGNGLAEPALLHFEHGRAFAAAPELLWNNGQGWVRARTSAGGGALGGRMIARGVAVADVSGNGSLDIVIAQNGGPPRLLRNDQRSHNAWLRIDLVGTHCQRDAGGARVEVHTPRGVLVQTMEPAMGFMAQCWPQSLSGLPDPP